jgi:hypothetical protein
MSRSRVTVGAAAVAAAVALWGTAARAQAGADAVADAGVDDLGQVPDKVVVSVDIGRGVTVSHGEALSMNLRGRVQLRDSVTVTAADGATTNELALRTARIYIQGRVLSPDLQYFLQLALGANDFETGIASPIFDAYVEYLGWRDLQLRAGQFLVPFDRARTIRDFALQLVDRAQMVGELSLDRDLGLTVSSQDLFGLHGWLGYSLGIFGGQGKNRFGPEKPPGFLYLARLTLRPWGPFDDELEGDLQRLPRPRLAVGGSVAFNQDSWRQKSTTGNVLTLGGFDELHAAGDVVFKFAGFSFMAEAMLRQANAPFHEGVVSGAKVREYSRSAWGYLVQASYLATERVELVARWDQLRFLGGDPALATLVRQTGRELGAAVNVYLNGHLGKVQADWMARFGDGQVAPTHQVRLALDVSF